MPFISDARYEAMLLAEDRVRAIARERDELRTQVNESSLLVAGAMRQGYVNEFQKEALTYAFCKLINEPSERIALLLVDIKPRYFR